MSMFGGSWSPYSNSASSSCDSNVLAGNGDRYDRLWREYELASEESDELLAALNCSTSPLSSRKVCRSSRGKLSHGPFQDECKQESADIN